MPRFQNVVLSIVALGSSSLLLGCQASGKSAATTDHAVMCPTCETVWVPEVTGQGTKVMTLQSRAKMVCPTCDAMAKSHLTSDGKVVLHACPDCKVTPQRVSSVDRPTHPKGTH